MPSELSEQEREALDYLVRMALGHDYADGVKITEAEFTIETGFARIRDEAVAAARAEEQANACEYCGVIRNANGLCWWCDENDDSPAPSEGDAEERGVHRNDYYDGDGFVYCQECYEALDDYVLISDCPARPAPTEGSQG